MGWLVGIYDIESFHAVIMEVLPHFRALLRGDFKQLTGTGSLTLRRPLQKPAYVLSAQN
jgi:hypothetical protein